MRYSWLFDVLRDMQAFSRENGFRALEQKLSETLAVAEAEIPTKVLRDLDHLATQEKWEDEREALGRALRRFEAGPQPTQSKDVAAWRNDNADTEGRRARDGYSGACRGSDGTGSS